MASYHQLVLQIDDAARRVRAHRPPFLLGLTIRNNFLLIRIRLFSSMRLRIQLFSQCGSGSSLKNFVKFVRISCFNFFLHIECVPVAVSRREKEWGSVSTALHSHHFYEWRAGSIRQIILQQTQGDKSGGTCAAMILSRGKICLLIRKIYIFICCCFTIVGAWEMLQIICRIFFFIYIYIFFSFGVHFCRTSY